MKTIKDFKAYLDQIEELAEPLAEDQKKDLENILGVVLTLLVALRKSSNLGEVKMDWMEKYNLS